MPSFEKRTNLRENELFKQIEALEPEDPLVLQKIEALKSQTTDEEILAILDRAAGEIAGLRLNKWLPRGAARRLIMLGIAAATVFGVVYSQSMYWLLLLLPLAMFSPRAMGETAVFLGSIRKRMHSDG